MYIKMILVSLQYFSYKRIFNNYKDLAIQLYAPYKRYGNQYNMNA